MISCGHCGASHATVAEVRACAGAPPAPVAPRSRDPQPTTHQPTEAAAVARIPLPPDWVRLAGPGPLGRNVVIGAHDPVPAPWAGADVLEESDIVGSSEVLKDEAIRLASEGKKDIMLITECGTADRVLAETEEQLNLIGACVMCRHMKTTGLEDILQALRDPTPEQIIELDEETIKMASKSLEEMFRLAE